MQVCRIFMTHFERNIAGDWAGNIKGPVPSHYGLEIYSRLQETLHSILFLVESV